MEDKITLIVTLSNRLQYARNMIISLQHQTKQIDELIFADDGSREILMDYIKDLVPSCCFNIKHVYQDDIGFRLARSRNNGARESRGDYLIFIDQDVIFDNDFIEKIYLNRKKKRMIFSEALGSSLEEKNQIQNFINDEEFNYEKIYSMIYNQKKIEQNQIVNKEKLYNFLYKLKLRDRGAKIVGLIFSLYKEDFININGLDEKYIGYGYEDDDFGNRFFKYGGETFVFKMNMYPIHMYHNSASPNGSPNEDYYRQRKKEISSKNYRCEYGYDKTFGEDKYRVVVIK